MSDRVAPTMSSLVLVAPNTPIAAQLLKPGPQILWNSALAVVVGQSSGARRRARMQMKCESDPSTYLSSLSLS